MSHSEEQSLEYCAETVDGVIVEPGSALVRKRGLDDVRLHLVDDFETAMNCMQWLSSRDADGAIAVDVETSGLEIGVDKVRLAQVGGRENGWAIPWAQWNGFFGEIMRRYTGRIVMHNAKFDYGMLSNQGETSVFIPTHRIDDTMLMSQIREPHMSKGLKWQAARHVDELAAGAQSLLNNAMNNKTGWSWENIPVTYGPYWQYGALDTVLTMHLFDVHSPWINAVSPRAYDLELAVLWVIAKMERYGAHVDVQYARENHDKFLAYVDSATEWVKAQYGIKPGSNAAIVKIFQEMGYKFTKSTASGAVALDKEVLGKIDHVLATTVLAIRQYQKIARTYLRHFIDEVDSVGCIHPSINTVGARTGRMSMQNPNLQNLPRLSETNRAANVVRNCIDARPGHMLIMCDFSQIEMRLLAELSQCTPMIDAFKNDGDFFVNLARQMYGDDTIDKKDKRRQLVKNGGYATIYGAGVRKFSQTAGITEAEGRAFFREWHQRYPEVTDFQARLDDEAWSNQRNHGVPFVTSPITGRRHVGDANKIYALLNFLIQGTAAEVFKLKLIQMAALGVDKYMVTPVHDEIILDVPTHEVPNVVHAVESVMNDDTMFDVPIEAAASFGYRWGQKKDWSPQALNELMNTTRR